MRKKRHIFYLKLGAALLILVMLALFWWFVRFLMHPARVPKPPSYYDASTWVSENPDICFTTKGEGEKRWNGSITVEGKKYPCKISTAIATIYFWKEDADIENPNYQDDLLFSGTFSYVPQNKVFGGPVEGNPKKMKVFVGEPNHALFDTQEIEFIRYELHEK